MAIQQLAEQAAEIDPDLAAEIIHLAKNYDHEIVLALIEQGHRKANRRMQGELIYTNAGNIPPVIVHNGTNETVETLERTGMALGVLEDVNWE